MDNGPDREPAESVLVLEKLRSPAPKEISSVTSMTARALRAGRLRTHLQSAGRTGVDKGQESVMPKLLLTPEEAAEALAIGRSKLYELLAAGALRSVSIGACRRIPLIALEQFVEELTASAAADDQLTRVS